MSIPDQIRTQIHTQKNPSGDRNRRDIQGKRRGACNRPALSPQEEPALPTPWSSPPSLQHCDEYVSVIYKIFSLWPFVTVAQLRQSGRRMRYK
jgi:hypothetical protein